MSDPRYTARPTPLPVSPAVSEPAAPAVYRPLSLPAVVGLVLAGAYAVVIVLGGLFTVYHSEPLLLGWWSLFPVASAAVALVGLKRIQRSEGTLAGEKAARWGLLLSVLFGFGYWAYFGATYFVIARDAKEAGDKFLGKLVNGDELRAFLLTLPPGERPPEDGRLRAQLEGRFNGVGEMGRKGPLGTFRQSEPVRMLGLGGPGTTFEYQGVDAWEYLASAYQVRLLYRIVQPQMTFVMALTLVGKEGKRSEGRQWQVVWEKTGMPQESRPQMTEEGKKLFAVGGSAREYLGQDWLKAMRERRVDDVFLATLPTAERETALKSVTQVRLSLLLADLPEALPCAAPGATLASAGLVADSDFVGAAALPGLPGFLAGNLVRAEPDVFWAPDDVREEVVKAAREAFRRPDAALAATLMPQMAGGVPVVQEQGDRLVIGVDVTLTIPLGAPRYLVDARLNLDCDAAEAAAGSVKTWRVRSLDLVSGKALPPGGGMRPDRPRRGM